MRRVCLLGLALTAACSDALEQTSSAGQVIGVVNAADNTVSFVSATDFSVRTVGLATPGGAATTAAGRGVTVIVPLGPADSVAVIHNAGLCTTRSEEHTSELQSHSDLVCRLLLEKKKIKTKFLILRCS